MERRLDRDRVRDRRPSLPPRPRRVRRDREEEREVDWDEELEEEEEGERLEEDLRLLDKQRHTVLVTTQAQNLACLLNLTVPCWTLISESRIRYSLLALP